MFINTQTCKSCEDAPTGTLLLLLELCTHLLTLQNKSFDHGTYSNWRANSASILDSELADFITASSSVGFYLFQVSNGKKTSYFPLYLLFNRDPYIVLFLIPTSLDSMSSPMYSNQPRSLFFIAQLSSEKKGVRKRGVFRRNLWDISK